MVKILVLIVCKLIMWCYWEIFFLRIFEFCFRCFSLKLKCYLFMFWGYIVFGIFCIILVLLNGILNGNIIEIFVGFIINVYNEFVDEESG